MDHVNYILVLLVGLLCCVAAVAGLARRFAVSYPIVLVIFGLVCSLLPRIPRIPLPPSLVFLVILPPLLYVAAWQTSWREFKYNMVSISSLAIFLVFFIAFAVAFAAARIQLATRISFRCRGFADRRRGHDLYRTQNRHASARRGSSRGREFAQRCDWLAGSP